MNRWRPWLARLMPLIGVALLVYFLSRANLAKMWTIVTQADVRWIALGLALVVVEVLCKASRFSTLIRPIARTSLSTSVWVYLLGQPFGAITPGQLGDFIKYIPLTRRAKITLAEGLAVGLTEKALDVISLLLAGSLGIYLGLNWHGMLPEEYAPFIVAAAVIAGVIGILTYRVWLGIARRVVHIGLDAYRAKLARVNQSIETFTRALGLVTQKRNLGIAFAFSFAAWMVVAARAATYGAALGIAVSPFYYFILVPAGIIVELLPISFMGVGVREYSLWFLFSPLGVGLESILSLALLHLALGPLPTALAGTILVFQLGRAQSQDAIAPSMEPAQKTSIKE